MTECAVCLLLQFTREFGVRLFVFEEGTKRSSDPRAKCGSEWRVFDSVRPVIDKESDDRWIPREQHVNKRDGFDISPVGEQQLHNIKPAN